MAARYRGGVLLVGALVVQSSVFVSAAPPEGCPAPGTTDSLELLDQITSVSPADVKPRLPSIGHIDGSVRQTGISPIGFQCPAGSGKISWQGGKAMPAGMRPFLQRGNDKCFLQAISLNKESSGEANMIFDYGDCAAAVGNSTDTKATVVVKVAKVNATVDTVSDFVERLCRHKQTEVAEYAKVKLTATETLRGKGKCVGNSSQNFTVDDITKCRSLCVTQMEMYAPECEQEVGPAEIVCMNKKPICRGYAYNSKSKSCLLYKGSNITNASGKDQDWTCKSTDLTKTGWNSKIPSTTTAPPPRLMGTQTATRAVVETFTSTKKCFPQFDWITLKDQTGQDATLGVAAAHWDKLMELFKSRVVGSRRLQGQLRSLSTSGPLAASLLLDSVSYGASTVGAVAAAAPPPPVVVPTPAAAVPKAASTAAPTTVTPQTITKVVNSDCDFPEVANAAISGVGVPVGVWFVVWTFYNHRHKGKKLDEGSVVYELMFAAAAGSVIVAAVATFVVRIVLTPICASSDHDVYIVALSIFMATVSGCVIALYFLGTKTGDLVKQKQQKFMIVATDDDGNAAEPLKSHQMVQDHQHESVNAALKTRK